MDSPFWLLAVDLVGVVLLGLSLFIQCDPHSVLATGPLGALKWPLFAVDGPLLLSGAVCAASRAVAHLRRGP